MSHKFLLRSFTIVNMKTRTALFSAVTVLAALVEIAAARSVPETVADVASYVIKTDGKEAVISATGQYVVETEFENDFAEERAKRQLAVPTWSCRGTFSGDGNNYNVVCNTNLEVISTECTLDGSSYSCGGLDFSVDTSNFNNGEEHNLQIRVTARYGNSQGTLRYTFRFRKQVTNFSVRCSSIPDGENLIITCTGTGITQIDYNVNGGSYRNSGSTSSFTILGSQLREGVNIIGLRISVNGVVRTTTLTAQKTRVIVFRPSCTYSYDNSGNVVFRCSTDSESDAVQSILYSINGGRLTTVSSVSQFQVNVDDILVGDNIVSLTFISASGANVTHIFTVRKSLVQNTFTPSCGYSSTASGSVMFSCSQGSGTQSIRTIRYSINGGREITATLGSGFEINANQLIVGNNNIRVTFISSSGSSQTRTFTARRTQSEVRSFSVRCGASYNDNHDGVVECSTQTPQSEDISTIYYTLNGGARQTASSTSGFQLDKSRLTREVNTIVVTLVSTSGLTRDLTLNLVQPLNLRCSSQTTSAGVTISCQTNRESSSLTVVCYLDGVRQSSCNLNSFLSFNQVRQGRHNYEVVVTDSNGLTLRNLISFENKVTANCRGSLNLGANVYSVVCDSDRDLTYRCFIDGQQIPCPENLDIDVSRLQAGRHTLQLVGSDSTGNTATSRSDFVIPQQVGSCTIDNDASDGIIDWTCTANTLGVSIVCLVDDIQLEPCLCQLSSEFWTERYSEGDHTVSLILTRQDGASKRFDQTFSVQPLVSSSSHAVEPLLFECTSEPKEEYVEIDCDSNKPVDLTCYLDDVEFTPCHLTGNRVAFADISQGPHTFAVVARDSDGLGERSEVIFEEDLDISCRGSYNPDYDVVHLACDSSRPLAGAECQLGDGASTACPTPFDLPVDEFVNNLTLRVSAHDNVGNTDTDELVFLTSSCEGC